MARKGRDGRRAGLRVAAILILGMAAAIGIRFAPAVWPGQADVPRSPDVRAVISGLDEIFSVRAHALVEGDPSALERVYETSGPRSATRALEHEMRKVRYVRTWASKRGVRLTGADVYLQVKHASLDASTAGAVVWQSLNVTYSGPGSAGAAASTFGIRTRHNMVLARRDGRWLVRSDEYTDPLGEDTLAPEVAPAFALEPAESVASADGPRVADRTDPTDGALAAAAAARVSRYDRARAVAYANRYCGVRMGLAKEFGYNPAYYDYTDLGGDCTNFISQVLADSEAGGIPTDSVWHYDRSSLKGASKAWAETEAFASYLIRSGMALLVARGSFHEIQAPTPAHPRGALAELAAGDLIAYEERGGIQHFAVIVDKGPSGYPLVNSHTADRYGVPWDLGWDRNTTFWLLKMAL